MLNPGVLEVVSGGGLCRAQLKLDFPKVSLLCLTLKIFIQLVYRLCLYNFELSSYLAIKLISRDYGHLKIPGSELNSSGMLMINVRVSSAFFNDKFRQCPGAGEFLFSYCLIQQGDSIQ